MLPSGVSSGGSYYERSETGGVTNVNSFPIDGKPIVNRIEGKNFTISGQSGGTQTGGVFQWDGYNGGRQEGRR